MFKTDRGDVRKMYEGDELIARRRLIGEMAAKLAMWLSDDASLSLAVRVFDLVKNPVTLAKVRRGHRALERRARRRLERTPREVDFTGVASVFGGGVR